MKARNLVIVLALLVALLVGGADAANNKKRWQGTGVPIYTAGTAMWADDLQYAANFWNGVTQKGPDFNWAADVSTCAWTDNAIVACNEYNHCELQYQSCTQIRTCGQELKMCAAVIYFDSANHQSGTPPQSGTWIATHELGHAIGLGHSNSGIMCQQCPGDWRISGSTHQELKDMGYMY